MPGMTYNPGGYEPREPMGSPVPITPPAASWPPPANLPSKKSHAGLIVGLVAVGMAVLLAAGTGAYFVFFYHAEQKQAITQCEARIKSMLRAPATAKFSNEAVAKVPPDGWNVTGDVDAENGFSALVRNQWDCYAHKNADGTWDVRPSILSN